MRKCELKRKLDYTVRIHRRAAGMVVMLSITAALVLTVVFAITHFRPMILELALATATDSITMTVNDTVSSLMTEGEVDCRNLVTLEKDIDGDVVALSTNIAGINVLQAKITNAIVERFAGSDITSVSVPIGNLIGGTLLSGKGPRITVDLLSVSNVRTSFRNEFTSAGINQTRHRIIMDVQVDFGIILAGHGEWESVLTEINVAETVIVGSVPDTYAEMDQGVEFP